MIFWLIAIMRGNLPSSAHGHYFLEASFDHFVFFILSENADLLFCNFFSGYKYFISSDQLILRGKLLFLKFLKV